MPDRTLAHRFTAAAAWLAFGAACAEGLVRLAFSSGVVPADYYWSAGPSSSRLGSYYIGANAPGSATLAWHPTFGWVPRPGAFVDHGSTITVDAGGLRWTGAREERDDRLRVLVVGDSFAFGSESDDAWWYGAELARRAPVDLVVLGTPGYGADQAWLRYEAEADRWQPDVVVYAINDLMRDRSIRSFELGPKPLIAAELGDFNPIGPPLAAPDVARAQTRWTSHILLVLDSLRWRRAASGPEHAQLAHARLQALAGRVVAFGSSRGHDVVVAWFATPLEVERAAAGLRHRMGGFACPRGATCVDLVEALLPVERSGAPVRYGVHWSEPASAAVAAALADVLAPRIAARSSRGPDAR